MNYQSILNTSIYVVLVAGILILEHYNLIPSTGGDLLIGAIGTHGFMSGNIIGTGQTQTPIPAIVSTPQPASVTVPGNEKG